MVLHTPPQQAHETMEFRPCIIFLHLATALRQQLAPNPVTTQQPVPNSDIDEACAVPVVAISPPEELLD
jgi:hypothetical protein